MAKSRSPSRTRRPFGIVVLAAIYLVGAALGVLELLGVKEARPSTGRALLLEALGDLEPVYVVVVILGVAIAVGLWTLHRWGWYGAMVWTGAGLAWQILLYLDGHQSYLYMVVYVVAAFYLNQREVKAAFLGAPTGPPPVVLEIDTSGPS